MNHEVDILNMGIVDILINFFSVIQFLAHPISGKIQAAWENTINGKCNYLGVHSENSV